MKGDVNMYGFSEETRESMFGVYNGFCHSERCTNKVTSFHHRLPQTKYNRKHYKLFIDSPMNCYPCCLFHHQHYSEWKISRKLATIYENYLQELRNDVPF